MKAWIDSENRAMVKVHIARHAKAERHAIHAWIDTAFDGHLVLPKSEIERLRLDVIADAEGVLANGATTRFRCYYCVIDWIDGMVPVQVIENDGKLPLIGTGLLSMVDLRINYRSKVCTLT